MEVVFSAALRSETETFAGRLHSLYAARITPPAAYSPKKCNRCSLLELCLPRSAGKQRSVRSYVKGSVADLPNSEEVP
jgi:CRISPR-associated exonuclease Cas4